MPSPVVSGREGTALTLLAPVVSSAGMAAPALAVEPAPVAAEPEQSTGNMEAATTAENEQLTDTPAFAAETRNAPDTPLEPAPLAEPLTAGSEVMPKVPDVRTLPSSRSRAMEAWQAFAPLWTHTTAVLTRMAAAAEGGTVAAGRAPAPRIPAPGVFPGLPSTAVSPGRVQASPAETAHPPISARGPAAQSGNRAPAYPASARRRGESGTVLVHTTIDTEGAVAAVALARSSGFADLDQAALGAVKEWRFTPALVGETAISCTADVPVVYVLKAGTDRAR